MNLNTKAVELLEAELTRIRDRASKEIEELQETIARLRKLDLDKTEENVDGSFPEVRPGQFSEMNTHTALRVYLRDRKGGPVSIARAAVDLALGGVSLGRPERHERNLKIMVSNNLGDFTYGDEQKTSVQLARGAVKRAK